MNDRKPTPAELVKVLYAAAEGRTPAGTNAAIVFYLHLLAEQAGASLPAELPEFVPLGTSAEVENQHLHHVEQDSANNPKRVEAHAALVASGDTANLQAEFAATIAELRALLKEMAKAGYTVAAEMVTADVFAPAASE
jgi:sirohydrochlorin ferrochelatase